MTVMIMTLLEILMMIFASITSVHTVFSMFMVSTPNPRPFKFTLSVLYNALQCRSGYT